MAKRSSRSSSAKKTTRKVTAKGSGRRVVAAKSSGGQPRETKRAGRTTPAGKKVVNLFVVGEAERLERLVEGFGNNRVAELLDVSRSQPSRWRQGKEKLSPESRRRLLDLDYVLSRLLQVYPMRQAEIWLSSTNAHLGSRPIDVLRLRGVSPVIEAIDAEAEGAYA
ncbi:MAG: hypothetical protein ACRDLB_11925 [Actinomycetota bacterium]